MNPHSVFSIQLNKARVVAILTPHFRRAPLLFQELFCVKWGNWGSSRMVRLGTFAVAKNCPGTRPPHPNQSSSSLNLIPAFPFVKLYGRERLIAHSWEFRTYA